MTQVQNAATAAPTVAHVRHRELSEGLFSRLACGFPRETRITFREMAGGLLMELEDVNCWTLAEAIGHSGPYRLQHLLSRASWDQRAVPDAAAAWAVGGERDGVDAAGERWAEFAAPRRVPHLDRAVGGARG